MNALRPGRLVVVIGIFITALALAACNAPPLRATPTATATVTRTPIGGQITVNPITPGATGTLIYTSSMSPTAAVNVPTATTGPAAPTSAPATLLPTSVGVTTPLPTAVPGTIIQSFTASTMVADPGETITLSWQTKGETVTFYHIMPTGQYGEFNSVDAVGSTQYTIDKSSRNSIQFQLVATAGGAIEYGNLSIKLTCPDTWFFDNPPAYCPSSSAVITGGVAQRFENGTMLWLKSIKVILVLHSGSGWAQYTDQWDASMPDSDPTIIPPPGYLQPLRGFGKVWRENNERQVVGWALAPEFAVGEIRFQCDSAPKYSTCYLLGPDGLLKLGPWGSQWEPYTGP